MDFLGSLTGMAGSFAGYLIPFLFVLTIVVFFHELGHFLVARWCKVDIEVFSIGFGPEIFGFNDRHGTRWRLSVIPLGGYVRFAGDDNAASAPDTETIASMTAEERAHSFHLKSVWQRMAIVAAGPIANFILAIVIFAAVFATVGRIVVPAQVDVVQAGSAAETAGFMPGDRVVEIDGSSIDSFADMQRIVATSAGKVLSIVVIRDGKETVLSAVPEAREVTDRFGNTQRIGILGISRNPREGEVIREVAGPAQALWLGAKESWFVIDRTLSYIGGIVAGRESADQLGGPIRIAQVSGQVAEAGFVALLHMSAVISVSIGLLNLFPVPMLDGGHLVFYLVEAVRGRPLSPRTLDIGYRIGLALVLMLMIFATWNDLIQLRIL